ncbi:unnamed protein product [Dicrocoelium dendriticum]|nr:unnamed protein product [Dicrocoelium dendriticum]
MHLLTIIIATLLALHVNGCINTTGNKSSELKHFLGYVEGLLERFNERFKSLMRVKALQEDSSSTAEAGEKSFFDQSPKVFGTSYTNLKPQLVRSNVKEIEEVFNESEVWNANNLQVKDH